MAPRSKKERQALSDFHGGSNCRAWEYLGAHPARRGRGKGAMFRVWAPMLNRFRWWGISTAGIPTSTPCPQWGKGAFGKGMSPA